MSKRKHKKTGMQKFMKKVRKFFLNGKPMSQVVHWTIILAFSGVLAIKMAEASQEIQKIQEKACYIMY